MRNETTTVIENQTFPNEITSEYSDKKIRSKIKKGFSLLKPTTINIIVTFVIFLIILVISKKLLITVILSLAVYALVSFFIQPLFKQKLGKKFTNWTFMKDKTEITSISSNSQSLVMYMHNKTLTALALLRIEWLANVILLNPVWNFLQEEGIQIQDCREGCFLVVRKNTKIKKMDALQEDAKKLAKELDKTILLTKKKFDLEFENLALYLVKGQKTIVQILSLGLSPEKFSLIKSLSDDEVEFLQNGSMENQQQDMEDIEQITN